MKGKKDKLNTNFLVKNGGRTEKIIKKQIGKKTEENIGRKLDETFHLCY